jgi:hypothetical protein
MSGFPIFPWAFSFHSTARNPQDRQHFDLPRYTSDSTKTSISSTKKVSFCSISGFRLSVYFVDIDASHHNAALREGEFVGMTIALMALSIGRWLRWWSRIFVFFCLVDAWFGFGFGFGWLSLTALYGKQHVDDFR